MRRAIIIGGSMGGLFAAHMLRQADWRVDIYERVGVELAGRGAGIVTHGELYGALEAAGLAVGDDLGVDVTGRRTFDRQGRIIGEHDRQQILTSWDRLFHVLRSGFPDEHYHKERNLDRVEQSTDGVTARFSDGTSVDADLLVGADGFRSTVRAQFAPAIQPIYVGYVAWRGLVAEAALSQSTHRDIFNYFAFSLPPGEQMLGYPVAGPENDLRPGQRRYNFVWYRPADELLEFPRLLTDATGKTHAISIPPPLIHPDVIREMRDAAERVLAPQFAEVVRLAEGPFFQPIYDLESERLAFGRVALVGDAAFVARPHVGAGVTKAAEDAKALADALSGHGSVDQALEAFQLSRLACGARIVQRARHLGAYMQSQLRTAEERQLAEKHRTPEAVMAETAVLDFLRAPLDSPRKTDGRV
jgi:2-polyprenyl-6-methoxyphenol hydroxylase-like FAD-dependent oxidoreductase